MPVSESLAMLVLPPFHLQDEINMLIQVETGSAGTFTSASLAVTVLGWATKHLIHLERESFCDALRATTIPGMSP